MRDFGAWTTGLVALGAAAVALGSTPTPARACGGFFCDNSLPVNQAAERIIFAQQTDGTVTAVIQIQYSGPSEAFAWMLPVAGNPEVAVSSDAAFQRLQGATNPSYRLNTVIEGECGGGAPGGRSFGAGAAEDASARPPPAGPSMEVTVVNQGAVGPYDFVVISVDPAAADKATVAVEWLQENGYDVNEFGSDMLRPYLDGGMNLIAFRLTKGNEAGSIRPVMLSFGEGLATIPIRPTAVAAEDDMGVMVFVLGASRAVPANYRSLELNESLINWLNPGLNYNDVVTRAANEAGGQGFVTEMAGDAQPFAEVIFNEFERERWESTLSQDWTNREGELLRETQPFAAFDGFGDAISGTLNVIPTGVTEEEFTQCVSCYIDFAVADIEGFEPEAYIQALSDFVIQPMLDTRALFEGPEFMTRLYTTMSADEMTMDPSFDFNPDLPAVDNNHAKDRIIECSPSVSVADAPWRIEFESGVLRGRGNDWPVDVAEGVMPANQRVRRVGTAGQGEVVVDNTAAIASALEINNEVFAGEGFCSAATGPAGWRGAGSLALLLLVLVGLRRQRL